MRFKFEAPERGLEFDLNLKGETNTVAVVGGMGSGKSLLAEALLIAIAGEPGAGQRSLRGVFPSLIWAGEGASAVYEKSIREKSEVLFYPYGPDNHPNHIEYVRAMTIHDSVALLAGAGNMLFACNTQTNMLISAMRNQADLSGYLRRVCPELKYTWEALGSALRYINQATPTAYSTLTCCVTAYAVASHCNTVIADFSNPGLPVDSFAAIHSEMIEIANRRSIKLISFMPPKQYYQADYDHTIKL